MASYAMVVGIDEYWTPGAGLKGAVKDALDFATWLVEDHKIAPQCILLVLGRSLGSPEVPDALSLALRPGKASYGDMSVQLGRLKSMVVESGATADRLFFFFAGHGISADSRGEQADGLCASDFTPAVPSLSFTTDSIEAHLRTIPAAEQYLFYDACRSIPTEPRMKLGEYDSFAFGKTPYPPQFVLKATAAGSEAVGSDEGGAFTQTLLAGVRDGAGNAKAWNDVAQSYDVKWRRLCGYVAARIGLLLPPGSALRIPQESGERPAGSDPLMHRFPAAQIPPTTLTVQSARPVPMFDIQVRLTTSFDAPETGSIAERPVTLTLRQGDYMVGGTSTGFAVSPPRLLVELYEPEVLTLALTPIADTLGVIETADVGPSIVKHEKPARLGRATIDSAMMRSGWAGAAHPTLLVRSGDPLTRIEIATLADAVVAAGSGHVQTVIDHPAYRISATGADGAANSRVLTLGDGAASETIEPPSVPSDATIRCARRAGLVIEDGILLVPDLPPIATPDLATLAAIGMAQAVAGGGQYADALGIVHRAAIALHVVAIDEAAGSDATFRPHGRVRLWQQQVTNAGAKAEFVRPVPTLPEVLTTSFAGVPGGYWLDCRDHDRKRRAGFKLSTVILPGYVTMVIVHRRPDASVGMYQVAFDRMASAATAMDVARQAMFVQRRRQSTLLATDDAATRGLIAGTWFEPVSAAVAAWLALRLYGDAAIDDVRALTARLTTLTPGLVDAMLLAARTDGDDPATHERLLAVLASGVSPLIDDALGFAVEHAREARVFGSDTRWLEEKARQSVRHKVWMMRREDDVKPAGVPLASR